MKAQKPIGASTAPLMDGAIALLLFAYPAVLVVVHHGINTAFALLLILSLLVLTVRRQTAANASPDLHRGLWPYAVAMAAMPVSLFLGELANRQWAWRDFDAPSRFLFAVPVFFALRTVAPSRMRLLAPGFSIGALAAAIAITVAPHDWGSHRFGTPFVNPIHFGDLALSLGVLGAFSIDWGQRDAFALKGLKALGFLAGMYASFISGTRGGWIAMPAFGILWLWFQRDRISVNQVRAILIGTLILAAATYAVAPGVSQRIDLIASDLHSYEQGHVDTSTGIRFQLWHVAWLLIQQHPLFGVGPEGFQAALPKMQQLGVLTPEAAQFGYGEVHNEILGRFARMGLFGLAATIAIYLVPLRMFARTLRDPDPWRRRSAEMGVVHVTAFFIYGLTVETFDLTMTAAFYALTTAVLLASATRNKEGPCSAI